MRLLLLGYNAFMASTEGYDSFGNKIYLGGSGGGGGEYASEYTSTSWPTIDLSTQGPLNIVMTGTNTNISPWTVGTNIVGGQYLNAPLTTNYPIYVSLDPNRATLEFENIIDDLFEKMVTRVKPGERIVVCVDNDVTDTQMRTIIDEVERKFGGVVIRGARAGTGLRGDMVIKEEDERVDILARIGEIWEQRPDLKLTDLLSWYAGESMEDGDFASAVEVHFAKVANGGIHGSA